MATFNETLTLTHRHWYLYPFSLGDVTSIYNYSISFDGTTQITKSPQINYDLNIDLSPIIDASLETGLLVDVNLEIGLDVNYSQKYNMVYISEAETGRNLLSIPAEENIIIVYPNK